MFEADIVLQQDISLGDSDNRYANMRFHRPLPKILYDPNDIQSVPSICGTMVH